MGRIIASIALLVAMVLGPFAGATDRAMAASATGSAPLLRTPYARELPSTGTVNVPAIVIDFSDAPATMSQAEISSVLFGAGRAEKMPLESLRAFYRRSSYGKLEIAGELLGVYHVGTARAAVDENAAGAQAALVADALAHFDARGTDFSRFDADGDGRIDYLIVMWTGSARRGGMWWGSYTVGGVDAQVDGKSVGAYAWVPLPTDFSARTLVHETGHALGLADLYDANRNVGPDGGVGAFDPMGDGSCDLNALSKIMLGWIQPRVVSSGFEALSLRPTSVAPDAVIVTPSFSLASPYREFYVMQVRARSGNDAAWPFERTAGLQVWQVDASLADSGRYRYNNSTTAHKFLRLVEADGLGEIEKLDMSNATDLFRTGATFSAGSMPASTLYDGSRSGVTIAGIKATTAGVTFTAAANKDRVNRGRQARVLSLAAAQSLGAPRR